MSHPDKRPAPFQNPEIVVVEASAGTGKTYALAKRYVRLILHLTRRRDQAPIHSILAITFTNKAAFEMKERILRFLKELALGVMDKKEREDILSPLDMSPEEAARIAGRVMETVLRNYNYFCVETIDKFINTLLLSSAFQIGLTANFRIKTGARDDLALALDELIDEASSNAAVRRAFDDLLVSMLLVEARSAWIPRDVLVDVVESLFTLYNFYARPFVRGGVTPEDLVRVKGSAVAAVQAFAERLPEGANKIFLGSVMKFASSGKGAFRFNDKLSKWFYQDIPLTKTLVLTPWHVEQWGKVRRLFREAAELEVRHVHDPYIEIFERVRERLADACRREDIVFLSELNAKARLVYEQGLAPEELYYRLSTRFEHYLIDEFQDTSVLQWDNLRVLPEDAIAKGGSLFYVGDKKQAIYEFRGGDTRLFDDIRRQYADPGYHPQIEYLNRSRRSHRSIVEFNNAIFDLKHLEGFMGAVDADGKRLIPARPEDILELQRVYGASAQKVLKDLPEGCVRVSLLSGANRNDIHDDARLRLIPLLKDLHDRFAWRDLCILVRKNDEVEEVTRWLLEEGVPSSSERTLNVQEHPLVAGVVSFLRFLASPVDNTAFAEFILGDAFLKTTGLSLSVIQDFILDWQRHRSGSLYTAFRQAYPGEWGGLIEEFFRNVGFFPLYELVVSFYACMRLTQNFPESQGFLMHFLDLLKSKEEEYPSLADFLEHYDALAGEDLYVDVPDVDAVRVMTVHKAKGLDFGVVVLPFLSMSLQKGSSKAGHALSYALRIEEEGLKLYHFNDNHANYSEKAEDLSVEEDMGVFFSELNSIYVALTRAKCEMYVFIPPKVRNSSRNLALELIPEVLFSLGSPAPSYPDPGKDDGARPLKLEPGDHRDWIAFLAGEFEDGRALLTRRERSRGTALHAVLEEIGCLEDGPVTEVVLGAARAAEQKKRLSLSVVECARIIEDLILCPGVRPFFFSHSAEVFREKDLVDRQGHTRRMDRVLVFEREVWVVDFKLAELDEGQGQVREYLSLLRDIYPGRVIRGFLVGIESGQVVEV